MTTTLLSPEFFQALPVKSDQLDQLTQLVLTTWGEQVAAVGGYAPELAPVIEKVDANLIAKQYTASWPATYAEFSEQPEPVIQAACLTKALGAIAQQMADLAPKRPVITGAMMISNPRRITAKTKIEEYSASVAERLVFEGLDHAMATKLAETVGWVSPRTLCRLLDVSNQTLINWRTNEAGPPYVKQDGRSGAIRYPLGKVLAWLFEQDPLVDEPERSDDPAV